VIIDADELGAGTTRTADVCIVGAGPAGIALAAELRTAGVRISLLESGGTSPSRSAQSLLVGTSVGYPYSLRQSIVGAYGGASHRWDGYWHSRPLDEIDFERRDEVPYSGWPFSRNTLAPYYARAERFLELPSFDGPEQPWSPRDAAQLVPLASGSVVLSSLLHAGLFAERELEGLRAAEATELVLGAHVAELLADDEDRERIAGVRCLAAGGRAFTVRAQKIVLAAGGIASAALLLRGNATRPEGIAATPDLIGRFFMEHPSIRSGFVVPSDERLLGIDALSGIHSLAGTRWVPILALDETTIRQEGLLNTYFIVDRKPRAFVDPGVRSVSTLVRAARLRPLAPGLVVRSGRAVAGVPATVRALAASRRGIAEVLALRVQAEQAPNPDSRITLGDHNNRLGFRTPTLDWRLSQKDHDSIRRTQELLGDALSTASLGRVDDLHGDEHPTTLFAGLHHHLGTTRMHADARQGVVDPTGRVHGTANLYVAGGSVFPTSGAANPTLTIVALAIRLADELRRS
jgi:choline dehydrogenase-like flavoprotein